MVLLEVVIYIGVAAALFTGLDVFLALKTARGRKSRNIDGGATSNGSNNDRVCGGDSRRNSRGGNLTDNMFCEFNEIKNNKMTKEPKLPHKLKWGDRTAARVDEVEYLIGIRVVGYTNLKDVIIAEVHESVADAVGAWGIPPEDLRSTFGGGVFMKKPRAGAYYKYIKLKNIVHEES